MFSVDLCFCIDAVCSCSSSYIQNPALRPVRYVQEWPHKAHLGSRQFVPPLPSHTTNCPGSTSKIQPKVTVSLRIQRICLDIVSVNPVGIVGAQDGPDIEGRGQGGSEAGAGARGAVAGVVVLLEGDVVGVGLTGAPLLPAGRVDDVAEAAALEGDTGVVLPGAAEVDGALTRVGRAGLDGRVGDDVVRDVVFRVTAVGRDGTRPNRGDGRASDPDTGGLAEDEVDGTLDVAVGVDLVTSLGEQGVLVTVPEWRGKERGISLLNLDDW